MISWSSTTLLLDGDKAEISTIKTVNFQLLTGHRKSRRTWREKTRHRRSDLHNKKRRGNAKWDSTWQIWEFWGGNCQVFQKCKLDCQNCWRPLFSVFGKFHECKPCLQNCWSCSEDSRRHQKMTR